MTADEVWRLLLQDFTASILEDAVELKRTSDPSDQFAAGQRMAYYVCLDRLKQFVETFGLDSGQIGLGDTDLEANIL